MVLYLPESSLHVFAHMLFKNKQLNALRRCISHHSIGDNLDITNLQCCSRSQCSTTMRVVSSITLKVAIKKIKLVAFFRQPFVKPDFKINSRQAMSIVCYKETASSQRAFDLLLLIAQFLTKKVSSLLGKEVDGG